MSTKPPADPAEDSAGLITSDELNHASMIAGDPAPAAANTRSATATTIWPISKNYWPATPIDAPGKLIAERVYIRWTATFRTSGYGGPRQIAMP